MTSYSFVVSLTLIWVGGIFTPPPCWFTFHNSETVEAVTLEFCSIMQPFIRDIRTKSGIPNLPQSSGIVQNSDRGISNLRISG